MGLPFNGKEVKMLDATFKDRLLGCGETLKAVDEQVFDSKSGQSVGVWICLDNHTDWARICISIFILVYCIVGIFHRVAIQILR